MDNLVNSFDNQDTKKMNKKIEKMKAIQCQKISIPKLS